MTGSTLSCQSCGRKFDDRYVFCPSCGDYLVLPDTYNSRSESRFRIDPEMMNNFVMLLNRINQLKEKAKWYHLREIARDKILTQINTLTYQEEVLKEQIGFLSSASEKMDSKKLETTIEGINGPNKVISGEVNMLQENLNTVQNRLKTYRQSFDKILEELENLDDELLEETTLKMQLQVLVDSLSINLPDNQLTEKEKRKLESRIEAFENAEDLMKRSLETIEGIANRFRLLLSDAIESEKQTEAHPRRTPENIRQRAVTKLSGLETVLDDLNLLESNIIHQEIDEMGITIKYMQTYINDLRNRFATTSNLTLNLKIGTSHAEKLEFWLKNHLTYTKLRLKSQRSKYEKITQDLFEEKLNYIENLINETEFAGH